MIRYVLLVAGLLAITFSAAESSAALIQTDPNGLAFHGRLTTATSGVYEIQNTGTEIEGNVYEPPNPGYQGSVMWIAGQLVGTGNEVDANAAELADGLQTYAEYTVRFTSEGTYRVHWSGQRTGDPQVVAEGSSVGGNDSVWIGPLDQDHTATTGWTNLVLGSGSISYRDSGVDWVIDGSNVNQDLTFTVGLREDGPIYDRLAFVLAGSGIGPNDLFVIPEPTSIVLMGFAAVGICCFRSRFAKR